jgi:N-acetylmuramoyl-L-alanine amidase
MITAPAYALSIDAVRFGIHPDKTRLVVEMDQISDFRAFTLDNPHRIVVDLPTYAWNAGNINKPKGSNVVDLRTGMLDQSTSRFVIDLSTPVNIQSAFVLPPSGNKPARLVIDFQTISPAEVTTAKQKRFGKLQTNNIETASPQTNTNFNVRVVKHSTPNTNNQTPDTASMVVPARKPKILTSSANINNTVIKSPRKKPHIVIDAGHGGQDPGAVSNSKVYEKRVTLAAAQALKQQLESTGRYTVSLTRDNDHYIKLYNRIKIARKREADMFISLHADSIGDKNVRGASIYTLSNKSSDAQTAKLAARENRADLIAGVDLTHEDKEVSDILIDLAMRDTMNQSKFFANTVVATLPKHGIKVLNKPHRYAGFAVLKAPDIPSVLIEMGFMSNEQDVRLLSSNNYRRKMASALVDSIDRYFQKVLKNQNQ